METLPRIEFRGIDSVDAVREKIMRYVAGLADRFETGHRLSRRGQRARPASSLYEVSIRLALPDGKEVNIARTPRVDERHSDIHFAVHDAYRRGRRYWSPSAISAGCSLAQASEHASPKLRQRIFAELKE